MAQREIDVAVAFLRRIGFPDVTADNRPRVADLIELLKCAVEIIDPDDEHAHEDTHRMQEGLRIMSDALRATQ